MAEDSDSKTDAGPSGAVNRKRILVVGGALLLLLGAACLIYFLTSGEKPSPEEVEAGAAGGHSDSVAEGAGDEDELEEGEEALGAILPLETFVINLEGGKYLRSQIQLEFVEREVPKRLYGKLVPLRDAIIMLLASKTAEDVLSNKGKETIREEIRDITNELMKKEDVKRVYFTQFVVQ